MTKPALITTAIALYCTLASVCIPTSNAQSVKDLQQSWWLQFQQKESTGNKAATPGGTKTPTSLFAGTTGGAGSSEVVAGAVQKGYFTVPAYFGTQPKPYERPVDIVRTPAARAWGSPLLGLTSMLPIPGIGFG